MNYLNFGLKILFLINLMLGFSSYGAVIGNMTFVDDSGEEIEVQIPLLKSREGGDLIADDLLSDINLLKNKLPQFQNIIMEINPVEGNRNLVEVKFEFQVKRIIKSIRLLTEGKLEIPLDMREKMRMQRESIFDSSDLQYDKNMIKAHFVEQGYPLVEVNHKIINYGNDEEVELSLTIKPITQRLVVKKLKLKGNKSFKTQELRKTFEMKPREFFLARHTVFSLEALKKDVSNLTDLYRDNGFLDVAIDFDYGHELDGTTVINVNIEEGKLYKIKEVRLEHSEFYSSSEVEKIYSFSKVKNYNDKELRNMLQKIREFYGERGHAKVQSFASYDSANEILLLKIVEGPIFKIDSIKIEGHEAMETETILLDVKIEEGETFNSVEIEKTMRSLKDTGYYEDVRIDFNPISEDNGELIISVKEARSRTISFGAGTGSSGVVGDLSFGDRNFLNTGNSVSLHLKKMAEMTKIGLVYRDPHLFDSDYSLNFSTTYTNDKSGDFEEEKLGATLMVEKKLSENLKLGVGTRIEFLNLSEIDEQIRMTDYNADGQDRVLGMIGTLFYKSTTKDAAGDTKEGVTIHMALLPSYSDQGAYLKAFSTIMGTQSLWENENGVSHSITGRLTIGYASENAPFHEKFYAGGVGTLRGFENKSVKTQSGTGGNILLSGSTGYSFPVWEDSVKGVVFLEAASVGNNLSDLGNIRAVGGIGVKANLMNTFLGSMIEAGVAIPLRKDDGDALKPFYFIFGDYDPAYDL